MISKSFKRADPISIDELWNFFNYSAVVFCIAGRDGFFKHVNSAFIKMLGFSREEFLNTPVLSFVHQKDKAIAIQNFRLITAGRNASFSVRCLVKKGGFKWLHWSVNNVRGHEFYTHLPRTTQIFTKKRTGFQTSKTSKRIIPIYPYKNHFYSMAHLKT